MYSPGKVVIFNDSVDYIYFTKVLQALCGKKASVFQVSSEFLLKLFSGCMYVFLFFLILANQPSIS